MEIFHLAPPSVAMTAGCVGTHRSWQCPHLGIRAPWGVGLADFINSAIYIDILFSAYLNENKIKTEQYFDLNMKRKHFQLL